MFNLEKLIRKNILELKAYSSARDEFKGSEGVFLDANENPFGTLNRYPDPYQIDLKKQLAKIKKVNINNVFIGNGSDEVIELALRIFCRPGIDSALTFSPSYGMYDVSAAINDVQLIKEPLNQDFQIQLSSLEKHLENEKLKLIFLCSPNNPTGNTFRKEDIENILEKFNGIVIIDEAYIDFSLSDSWVKFIEKYPNLIVSQTFSKAWGLAAARVGVAYSNPKVLNFFNKVKPPYNVSELNQKAAIAALNDLEGFDLRKNLILSEKKVLIEALNELDFIEKIHPSDANFILIKMANANKIYTDLIQSNIVVRNRHKLVDNCLRITIGTREENQVLITHLKSHINCLGV